MGIRKWHVCIVLTVMIMVSVGGFSASEDTLFIKAKKVPARDLLKIVAMFSNQNIVVMGPLAPLPIDFDRKEISASEAFALIASQVGMITFFRDGIRICGMPEILTEQNQLIFSGKMEGTKWISLDFLDADIRDLIRMVANRNDYKPSPEMKIRGNVTCRFVQVLPEPALRALMTVCGCSCTIQEKTIFCEKKIAFNPILKPLPNKASELIASSDEALFASSPLVLQAIIAKGEKRYARFSKPATTRSFLGPGDKLDEIYTVAGVQIDEVVVEDTRTGKKIRVSFDKPVQPE